MSEEDINFLISIQDLEQPEFDNACLERENERLRKQLQQKENIIKEVREFIENNWISQKDADIHRFDNEELEIEIGDIAVILEILDKENK